MNDIRTIVFTGGPGGGKSTLIGELSQQDSLFGRRIITVSEVATSMKDDEQAYCGNRPLSSEVQFQRRVMRRQIEVETEALEAARAFQGRAVVILDSGIFDAVAFVGEQKYRCLLKEHLLTPEQVIRRYYGVLFLRSAAAGFPDASERFRGRMEREYSDHIREVEK